MSQGKLQVKKDKNWLGKLLIIIVRYEWNCIIPHVRKVNLHLVLNISGTVLSYLLDEIGYLVSLEINSIIILCFQKGKLKRREVE